MKGQSSKWDTAKMKISEWEINLKKILRVLNTEHRYKMENVGQQWKSLGEWVDCCRNLCATNLFRVKKK